VTERVRAGDHREEWGPFEVAGVEVAPGQRRDVDLRVGELYTADPIHIPFTILRGAAPGPTLFVVAAVHGDELNGVEVVRTLLYEDVVTDLRGTLLLLPVVNVYGFLLQSRYLPDQRDLNRHFPGTAGGSGASRMAHCIMAEIVSRSDYGIDLHTAGRNRANLPHVRADISDPRVRELARAFGTQVVVAHPGLPGSLRHAALSVGVPVITYEAGEPLKFQRNCIDEGVRGCLRVMADLGMVRERQPEPAARLIVNRTIWVRAERGGILDIRVTLGQHVEEGDLVGVSSNPFGRERSSLLATARGIVLGRTTLPMVNPGDPVCCIGRY
jgi:predicted deacylase